MNSTSAGGIHGNNFKGHSKEDHFDSINALMKEKQKLIDKTKAQGHITKDDNENWVNVHHNLDAHWYHAKKKGSENPFEDAKNDSK